MSSQSLKRGDLEGLVLDGLRHRLMEPEHVKSFITGFCEEVNRQRAGYEVREERSAAS